MAKIFPLDGISVITSTHEYSFLMKTFITHNLTTELEPTVARTDNFNGLLDVTPLTANCMTTVLLTILRTTFAARFV